MTEREHCMAVADAWVAEVETHRRIFGRDKLVTGLADLLQRERAAAWLAGRDGGIDTARRVFEDIRVKDVAEARDQALEAAACEAEKVRDAAHELAMEQTTKAEYLAHQGVSEGADAVVGCIRALKAKP